MNSSRRRTRRGVMGIEAAIVMIAFVIVAAALAFVVLNMGFSTTQKAKMAVVSSQTEASSALEIAGKVTGIGFPASGVLNATIIPIKVASGGDAVNLSPTLTDIKYYSNTVRYDNIYSSKCLLTSATYGNVTGAFNAAVSATCIDKAPISGAATPGAPTHTQAMIYWDVAGGVPLNGILSEGQHANVAIAYQSSDRPSALDNIKAEIIVPTGSALTIERQVPSVTTNIVDLG
ncbi:MAG: flagellin [Thaumarchaeota archaeon]|nr:flagellin [Nitrososphaerota archaeon]MDE1765504.1 flagellin [Nitrososphaerota archaeon]